MKTTILNRATINDLLLTSGGKPDADKNNTPANIKSNLAGFTYTDTKNGLVSATNGSESYEFSVLAALVKLATKLEIDPRQLELGQIQDKLVLPSVSVKDYPFKTSHAQKEPLTGHILASDKYLTNALAMLPPIEVPSVETVLASLIAVNEHDTKAVIWDAVTKAIELLTPKQYTVNDLTPEQKTAYDILKAKEEAIDNAKIELSKYLDDIKVLSEFKLSGLVKEDIASGQNKELETELAKLLTESYESHNYKSSPAVLDGFVIVQRDRVLATITLKQE